MRSDFLLSLEVFVLIMAILNIIKHAYNFAKVYASEEGKLNISARSTIIFGASLSYIITAIICGF